MNQSGFTLLETMVAFAIAALLLSGVYAGLGSGLAATAGVHQRLGLALAAEDLLDAFANEPPVSGTREGTTRDGYSYRVQFAQAGYSPASLPLHPVTIMLTVRAPDSAAEFTLTTVRLMEREP